MLIKLKSYILPVGAALIVAGCGTTLATQNVTKEELNTEAMKQREFSLMERYEIEEQVRDTSFQVLKGAVSLCDETDYNLGIAYWSVHNYAKEWQAAAKNQYHVSDAVTLKYVYKNSPAAKAGLKVGDQILKVNNNELPIGKQSVEKLSEFIEKAKDKTTPISIVYARDNQVSSTKVTPVKTCGYNIQYDDSAVVNAYADGKNITIVRGMVEFTRTDDELAMVIGHELAHNVLSHIDKKTAQMTAGMLGGLLLDVLIGTGGDFSNMGAEMGANAYSPEYESEADYMGLYASALAGYDIVKAPYLWRRMGARNTGSITMTSTHPPTAARFVALEKTVAEIQYKLANNKPLVPEKKANK